MKDVAVSEVALDAKVTGWGLVVSEEEEDFAEVSMGSQVFLNL
jgi:hypothetical protein